MAMPLWRASYLVSLSILVYQFRQTVSSDVLALLVQSLCKVHAVIDTAKIHIIASETLVFTDAHPDK